jgi:hypothetical protein
LSSPALRDCFFGIYAELVEVAMEKERKKKMLKINKPILSLKQQKKSLHFRFGILMFNYLFL